MSSSRLSDQINQLAQAFGVQWSNRSRLLDIQMPHGIPVLVESLEGIESILGMPVPQEAEHLLPDPAYYPASSLHSHSDLTQQQRLLLSGYRYRVYVLSDNAHHRISEWLNQPVSLSLQTDQLHQLRAIHGLITHAACIGSNGGFARYELIVEPWTAYLRLSRYSRVYLRQHVADIIKHVCQPVLQQGVGALDIHPDCYQLIKPFAHITQYQETDWHFMQRLLQETGLVGWYTHHHNQHTLHIAPAEQRLTLHDTQQISARYHRQSSVEQQDTVQQLYGSNSRNLPQSQWHLYDPRHTEGQQWQGSMAHQAAQQQPAQQQQYHQRPSPSLFTAADAMQRLANIWQAGQQQQHQLYNLHSSLRTLASMDSLSVLEHPRHPAQQAFKILSVYHQARNNITVELQGQQHAHLQGIDSNSLLPNASNKQTGTTTTTTTEYYRNHVLALAVDDKTQGLPLACYIQAELSQYSYWLKRPVAQPQSAIVVGGEQPHDTERNHRLKIQYHWQRGEQPQQPTQLSHERLSDNAPANDSSSLWVNVATGNSGDHMGNVLLPRKGQEVMVHFVDHDIDQPIILAAHYNGQGQADQNGSQLMAASQHVGSNSPAWSSTQQQPDAIRGIKTQSMSLSQSGLGKKAGNHSGYNQLAFDQSPQAWRIELSSTSYRSQLQQGSLKHQQDMQLKENRGHGFAVETEAAVNLRAEQGQLLSSHSNNTNQYMQVHSLGQLQQAAHSIEQWQQQAMTHQAVGVTANQSDQHSTEKQSPKQPSNSNPDTSTTFNSPIAQSVQDSMDGISLNTDSSGNNTASQKQSANLSSNTTALQGLQPSGTNSIAHSMGGLGGGVQRVANNLIGKGINTLSQRITDQLGDALGDALQGLQHKFADQLSPAVNDQLHKLLESTTDINELEKHISHILPKENALQQQIMGHLKGYLGNNIANNIGNHLNKAVSGQVQQLTGGLLGQPKNSNVGNNASAHQNQPQTTNQQAGQQSTSSNEQTENSSTETSSTGGGGSGWNNPSIVIEAPGVSALLTPQHLGILATGQISSQSDTLDILSQGNLHQLARENIELFAAKDLRMTAGNGRFRAIAHTGQLRLDARQDVNIASRADLIIQAPDTIKLIAGGSAIEISGGNITLTSSGKVQMLAAQKKHVSGGGGAAGELDIKQSEMKGCQEMKRSAAQQQSATVELG